MGLKKPPRSGARTHLQMLTPVSPRTCALNASARRCLRRRSLVALILLGVAGSVLAGESAPRELGKVRWHRDFDAATAESRASGRPLFVLFQEVPGCSTCVSFGDQVLSHPLLVDAIEKEFI